MIYGYEISTPTDRFFWSYWSIFCTFTPLTAWKKKLSKTWKKHLKISFYTSVPKIMITGYTVPGIWHMTDVTVTFWFWAIFCLFTPLTAQKIKMKDIKKKKKNSGDITILHKCTKKFDHMLYCFWDMACDGCNCCFSFWVIFCPFTTPPPLPPTSPNSPKNENFKKMKRKPGHNCTKTHDHMPTSITNINNIVIIITIAIITSITIMIFIIIIITTFSLATYT